VRNNRIEVDTLSIDEIELADKRDVAVDFRTIPATTDLLMFGARVAKLSIRPYYRRHGIYPTLAAF
jgi:hypothetical protein